MKYTDEQRIEKIRNYTEKLLAYIKDNSITGNTVEDVETVRWAITTPLYILVNAFRCRLIGLANAISVRLRYHKRQLIAFASITLENMPII